MVVGGGVKWERVSVVGGPAGSQRHSESEARHSGWRRGSHPMDLLPHVWSALGSCWPPVGPAFRESLEATWRTKLAQCLLASLSLPSPF